MTPAQFRQAIDNAYIWRDRPAMESAIRTFTDPDLARLSIEHLQERRSLLLSQLAAVNEYLQRAEAVHRAAHVADRARWENEMQRSAGDERAAPLDPSDP